MRLNIVIIVDVGRGGGTAFNYTAVRFVFLLSTLTRNNHDGKNIDRKKPFHRRFRVSHSFPPTELGRPPDRLSRFNYIRNRRRRRLRNDIIIIIFLVFLTKVFGVRVKTTKQISTKKKKVQIRKRQCIRRRKTTSDYFSIEYPPTTVHSE